MAPPHSSLSCIPPVCPTNTPLCLSVSNSGLEHENTSHEQPRKTKGGGKKSLLASSSTERRYGGDLSRDPGLVSAGPGDGGGSVYGVRGSWVEGGGVGRWQGAGSGGREARAVGVPGVSRRRQGHLRQPPLAAARRPPHRHRRPRPRRARLTRPRLQAGREPYVRCVLVLLFCLRLSGFLADGSWFRGWTDLIAFPTTPFRLMNPLLNCLTS
jgi:hypothetical protein